MFLRFKKNRRAAPAPVQSHHNPAPAAGFGLFGVYVRSLPHIGR